LKIQLDYLAGQTNTAGDPTIAIVAQIQKIVRELDKIVNVSETSFNQLQTHQSKSEGPAGSAKPQHDLSANEYIVMRNIIEGKSIKQIAHEMCISPSTVSTYRSRLLGKLKIASDADLIRYGMQHHIDHPIPPRQ
ncbi:MAG: DNA-binding response regulator, partial [Dehalococcoidia bacterium]